MKQWNLHQGDTSISVDSYTWLNISSIKRGKRGGGGAISGYQIIFNGQFRRTGQMNNLLRKKGDVSWFVIYLSEFWPWLIYPDPPPFSFQTFSDSNFILIMAVLFYIVRKNGNVFCHQVDKFSSMIREMLFTGLDNDGFFSPLHQSASEYLKFVFFAFENSPIVWQVFIFKWYRRSGNPCGKWKKFRKLSYIAKRAYMTTKVTSKSRYIASLSRNDFLKRALPLVWCLVWLVCAVIQWLRIYIRSLIKGRTKSYSIAINHFLSKSSRFSIMKNIFVAVLAGVAFVTIAGGVPAAWDVGK